MQKVQHCKDYILITMFSSIYSFEWTCPFRSTRENLGVEKLHCKRKRSINDRRSASFGILNELGQRKEGVGFKIVSTGGSGFATII